MLLCDRGPKASPSTPHSMETRGCLLCMWSIVSLVPGLVLVRCSVIVNVVYLVRCLSRSWVGARPLQCHCKCQFPCMSCVQCAPSYVLCHACVLVLLVSAWLVSFGMSVLDYGMLAVTSFTSCRCCARESCVPLDAVFLAGNCSWVGAVSEWGLI